MHLQKEKQNIPLKVALLPQIILVFFYPIGQKKDTLGPLFRSKNDENRACVTKNHEMYYK